MKKNVFFIFMLAGMLSFAFSAEKGLTFNIPSALAGHSKDSKDSKDSGSKDSEATNSGNGTNNGSCTCPPGIASCICANGSTGNPGPGSLPTTPNSLRSVHGS